MAKYRPKADHNLAISADQLRSRNVLSFTSQPHLKSLFEEIADTERRITIFVGAGVSLDSKFPTWRGLIERVATLIPDKRARSLALADSDDPMRMAESVVRMAKSSSPDYDVVRDALYRGTSETVPGSLARAVARLCYHLGPRVSLITSNFDDVLEVALNEFLDLDDVESFTLDDTHAAAGSRTSAWTDAVEADRVVPVLHLHGMVRRGLEPLRPVILAESHFLRYGSDARKVVLEQVRNSAVIFLGVSLNDPNVVGPLWDAREEKTSCFTLHVPARVPGSVDIHEARAYVIAKHDYLESRLKVKPIFLKSYSQLTQVVQDLDLALAVPDLYFNKGPDSVHYGERFRKALSGCYARIGSEDSASAPVGPAAAKLSSDLAAALDSELEGSLGRKLDQLERQHRKSLRQRKNSVGDVDDTPERFGLFLWLRTGATGPGDPPYELCLVGTSTYIHNERWSFERRVEIVPDSAFPVATAVFNGMGFRSNLPPGGAAQLWNGCLVTPLRLAREVMREGDALAAIDSVTVGAVSLNTTKCAVVADPKRTPKSNSKTSPPVSLLAVLQPVELLDLQSILELMARDLVLPEWFDQEPFRLHA